MKENDLRFALLIDADNISAKYISGILDEMTTHGTTTYKRIYGDWTNSRASKWREQLLEKSIMPIQQFSNTIGKNATDSALIIDAMDILYTHNVDGFCIVSSDSDFTRLASRLRESGMVVIGMGEDKTPQSFRAACSIFTNLENLLDEEEAEEDDKYTGVKAGNTAEAKSLKSTTASAAKNKETIINTIIGIITENDDKDIPLSEIGNRLVKKYPDFDVRSFGYSSLTRFIENIDVFEIHKDNNLVFVSLKDDKDSKENVIKFINSIVQKKGANGIGINELSNIICHKNRDFSVKKYGYSQFSKFVQSIVGIEVYEDKDKRKRARIVKK